MASIILTVANQSQQSCIHTHTLTHTLGHFRGTSLYVSNLAWETSWQNLKDVMAEVGPVSFADILRDPSGRSKGCGIVVFQDPESANRGMYASGLGCECVCTQHTHARARAHTHTHTHAHMHSVCVHHLSPPSHSFYLPSSPSRSSPPLSLSLPLPSP